MASPILRGGDLVVTERGIRDAVRQAVLPLWNSWYFLALYSNASGREGTWRADSKNVLDRYALAKTHDLYVVAGWLSAILGDAAFDLGDQLSARIHLNTAWQLAHETDHHGLVS